MWIVGTELGPIPHYLARAIDIAVLQREEMFLRPDGADKPAATR